MLKTKTMLENNKYELTITIDAQTFAEATDKAYLKDRVKMAIPGFRKGKAPRKLLEQYYGEGAFYETAFNALYPQAVEDAVKEAELIAVSRPELNIESIGKDGVEFKAVIWVKPTIEVGEYKGIEVEKPSTEVTEEEINAEVDKARERGSRILTIDGKAEKGHITSIDFEGFVDGTAFEGGKAEKYDLTLGSGAFIPGFEDQIIGHIAGDEFDVNVEFPNEYGAEQLAGKKAVFKTKLHEVKKKEIPELDDEFVKDVSEFNTVDEYKNSIRERLQKDKESKADDAIGMAVTEKLCELVKGDIPEVMFESAADRALQDFDYRSRMQGFSLEQYMQMTGMGIDELRGQFRKQGESRVKSTLALEKIAELEKIEVTDEEIEAEFVKEAEKYGRSADELKKVVSAEDMREDMKTLKAYELVKNAASVKPAGEKKTAKATKKADDTAEEKPKKTPAKKPAAKKDTTEKEPAADKAE
ncbi:MAG TPA: trigger factor [Oscillospiraceae bacterium]|nr:trigger factor [Oscillospiraceae bacterium]HPF56682.1 trigger factor [Clostridiales bacterium]HPK34315.1 trigger factor [Oscillospiraceae bacterium]HPR75094.1 trigger factor [Oscillospiraceae bacterium]